MTPMAVASDGTVIVNAGQLTTSGSLAAIIKLAESTGLAVFVGVIIPAHLRGRVLDVVDDALADVVGRLGPKITGASSSPESASVPSEADARRGDRDRGAGRAPRQRGRQP